MGVTNFSVYTTFKAKDNVSQIFKNMRYGALGFGNQLNKLTATSKAFGSKIQSSFNKVNTAVGATVAFFAANQIKQKLDGWVESASNLQETMGKTEQTFKTNSAAVVNWAKTSITTMGLARQTALDTASLYGDMGTGMGMSTQRASEMSMRLTQLSADLSSYKNVSQDIIKNALKGIFTGETEALKNLGTVMTQDLLESYAKTLGMRKKFKDMSQTEKIELRFAYVMKSNKNADGDFLRTGGNYANQSRKFAEQQIELQTRLGEILLPKYNGIIKSMNALLIKYSPTIETNFKKIFNMVEKGIKACMPIFKELSLTITYLSKTIFPEFGKQAPLLKAMFENVLVPGVVVAIKVFNLLLKVCKGLNDFIRITLIPILPILSGALSGLAVYKAVQFFQALQVQLALLKMQAGGSLLLGLKNLTIGILVSTKAVLAQNLAFLASPLFWIPAVISGVIALVVLLWKNWDKVTVTLKILGNFIKNNFTNILLAALGPVGLIVQGLMKIPLILNNLKGNSVLGNPQIALNKGLNKPNVMPPLVNNNYMPKQANSSGIIEVRNIVENKNGSSIGSSVNLISSNGLKLNPAF